MRLCQKKRSSLFHHLMMRFLLSLTFHSTSIEFIKRSAVVFCCCSRFSHLAFYTPFQLPYFIDILCSGRVHFLIRISFYFALLQNIVHYFIVIVFYWYLSNVKHHQLYKLSFVSNYTSKLSKRIFQDWCYRFALSIFENFCHHKLRSSFNVPFTHMSHYVHRQQIEYWLAKSDNILKCLQQGTIVEWNFGRTEYWELRVPKEITGCDTFTITNIH